MLEQFHVYIYCCFPKLYKIITCVFSQAAFLSALAGVEIAEVAARAAVTTLSDVDDRASKGSLMRNTRQRGMNSNPS